MVKSSKFYMAKGDVLHILLKDWTCDFTIGLVDGDGDTEGVVPVQEDAVDIGFTDIKYGLLYNWYAIDDARNIAPEGWHVPTRDEFVTLYEYLGGGLVAGGKLKETGYTYWKIPNTGATNEVSFNGRGTGYRHSGGFFEGILIYGDIWSSSNYPSEEVYFYFRLNRSEAYAFGTSTANPYEGKSLRLIKDDSTNPGYMIGNDSKIYPTVKIGNQVWMACNSAETMYRTGADIPEVTGNAAWIALTTGAMCAYDNNWDNAGAFDYEPAEEVEMVVTDYDGNEYDTVIIGDQEWLVQNLKVTHYSDGVAIPNLSDDGDWADEDGTSGHDGAYCYYDNDSDYNAVYGKLYNHFAVVNARGLAYFKRRGVYEAGWRIPTEADYEQLRDYVGDSDTAGGYLKEVGITHWSTPNTGATDAHGFTALPGGYRYNEGAFYALTQTGYFWDSTVPGGGNYGNSMRVYYISAALVLADVAEEPALGYGYSVRCVKDI